MMLLLHACMHFEIINEITEQDFNKLSKKFNKIMNKSYKYFYKDGNNNKFVFIPDDIIYNRGIREMKCGLQSRASFVRLNRFRSF